MSVLTLPSELWCYIPVFVSVAVFSVIVNLLMLTGSLFMLQAYERVLGSCSVEALIGLFILVAFLFLLMGPVQSRCFPEGISGFRLF